MAAPSSSSSASASASLSPAAEPLQADPFRGRAKKTGDKRRDEWYVNRVVGKRWFHRKKKKGGRYPSTEYRVNWWFWLPPDNTWERKDCLASKAGNAIRHYEALSEEAKQLLAEQQIQAGDSQLAKELEKQQEQKQKKNKLT